MNKFDLEFEAIIFLKMEKSFSYEHVTGHSGNELFCLQKLGMRPGHLCLGNSVLALSAVGGIGAAVKAMAGGEVVAVTKMISQARQDAYANLVSQAKKHPSQGMTGVNFELTHHGRYIEFVGLGSAVHMQDSLKEEQEKNKQAWFSSAGNAQQLFCFIDAGYAPKRLVFGNVAYSIGIGGNVSGWFRSWRRGEVQEYTAVFDKTRRLALERLCDEARRVGAQTVVGVQTTIAPLFGAQEMAMIGTAAAHPAFNDTTSEIATSALSAEEQWNVIHLGLIPLQIVMGVSVYALGLAGSMRASLSLLTGGNVETLTALLVEAREKALERIELQAQACGADAVVGVKMRVFQLGRGLVEVMAMGTAVKRNIHASTHSPILPIQATIENRSSLIDSARTMAFDKGDKVSASVGLQGPLRIIIAVLVPLIMFAMTLAKIRLAQRGVP